MFWVYPKWMSLLELLLTLPAIFLTIKLTNQQKATAIHMMLNDILGDPSPFLSCHNLNFNNFMLWEEQDTVCSRFFQPIVLNFFLPAPTSKAILQKNRSKKAVIAFNSSHNRTLIFLDKGYKMRSEAMKCL